MKSSRIDGLSDGIFAIVMTLLIIEIRVPELHAPVTDLELWSALLELAPLCLSYVLSFTLLFTYWRAHCYVISIAKRMDLNLTNYNALFLFFVGLLPFTTHLLGSYHHSQLSLLIYGLNILLIGLSLYSLRRYIIRSEGRENLQLSEKSIRHGNIRILVPVFFALVAMGLCFLNIMASMTVFTILIIFNLTKAGADVVDFFISKAESK